MVNKVILIGNLGKDPEIKTFDNGNSLASFSLATNETYKDKNGERQTKTEWHNISVGIPTLVSLVQQYFKKGDPMYLEGKLRTRDYEKEGQKRYITEIQVETIRFLPKAGGGNNGGAEQITTSNEQVSKVENTIPTPESNPFTESKTVDDDLPF